MPTKAKATPKPKVHAFNGYLSCCGLQMMRLASATIITRNPRRVTCKTCRRVLRVRR